MPEKSAVRARVPLETGPLYREISVVQLLYQEGASALEPWTVVQIGLYELAQFALILLY